MNVSANLTSETFLNRNLVNPNTRINVKVYQYACASNKMTLLCTLIRLSVYLLYVECQWGCYCSDKRGSLL